MDTPQAIWEPGLHDISMDTLSEMCVLAFPGNERRKWLYDRLSVYLDQLAKVGVRFEVWVDGSFITSKEIPSDIDIVLWCNGREVDSLPPESQDILISLVGQRHIVKLRYGLDVYIETLDTSTSDGVNARGYWRGMYCFVKETEAPKGVPRLAIGVENEPDSMA